ncbi:MAG: hypothetical protein EKK55_24385 [Rhodocyclaceae bacterium]|nr:MAG: hypothetical protein EKK55_24385 [Rhodocyclaceae bacterium]
MRPAPNRAQHPEHLDRLAAKQAWSLADAFAAVSASESTNRRQRAELRTVLGELPKRHRTVIKGLLRSETQREIGRQLGVKQPAVSVARRRAIDFARFTLRRPRPEWTEARIRAALSGLVDGELLDAALDFARGETSGPIARRLDMAPRKLRDVLAGFERELLAMAVEAADVLAERLAYRREHAPCYRGSAWSRGRRLRPERARRPVQLDLFAASYRASGSTTHPN